MSKIFWLCLVSVGKKRGKGKFGDRRNTMFVPSKWANEISFYWQFVQVLVEWVTFAAHDRPVLRSDVLLLFNQKLAKQSGE